MSSPCFIEKFFFLQKTILLLSYTAYTRILIESGLRQGEHLVVWSDRPGESSPENGVSFYKLWCCVAGGYHKIIWFDQLR